ncbi:unnamed protein product [Lepidochelys kempii]
MLGRVNPGWPQAQCPFGDGLTVTPSCTTPGSRSLTSAGAVTSPAQQVTASLAAPRSKLFSQGTGAFQALPLLSGPLESSKPCSRWSSFERASNASRHGLNHPPASLQFRCFPSQVPLHSTGYPPTISPIPISEPPKESST